MPTLCPLWLEYLFNKGQELKCDLPPTSRTSVISGKSVNMENDGYEEEQIHRRANHRVHQTG